jgi:hypothetical protein
MSTDITVVSSTQIIVVDPASKSISVINAGPPGPAGPGGGGDGTDRYGPEWSGSGVVETLSGTKRWYPPVNSVIVGVRISAHSVASLLRVDVNRNGTTIFTTQANRPSLTTGEETDLVTIMDVTSLSTAQYLTVDIDDADGEDLVVQVYCEAA